MPSETIKLSGHLIDAGLLTKLLDVIDINGGEFSMQSVQIGKKKEDTSEVLLAVSAGSEPLARIISAARQMGATFPSSSPAYLAPSEKDRVVPDDFYSTTNLSTWVNIEGEWVPAKNQRMDKVIVIKGHDAYCTKQNEVKKGDMVVVGSQGVRTEEPNKVHGNGNSFSFMSHEISSERDTELQIMQVAGLMKEIKKRKGKIAFVIGPVIVHTGGGKYIESIIRKGYVDLVLSGNAAAVHDIELAIMGTTLGMSHASGNFTAGGNRNHISTINRINKADGIKKAVESGLVSSGVFFECEKKKVPYVLAGSLRDDGPIPEVITDMNEAQKKYYEALRGTDLVIMLASTLHSIGVGNMIPASTITVCVDINPATVVKLNDRGSGQAVGIVTDVSLFAKVLDENL